ncbi:MAG: primosomal protein N' [Pseudomonadota bacterium]|nr:primosomal protein N' [Pseudomonadota bacterium]
MIYEILLPLPIDKTFYYELPKSKIDGKLPIGSLVEVEFQKKILVGLVVNLIKKKSFSKSLKEIKKIFKPYIFNKEILNSLFFISRYTCNNASMILKLFLSSFPSKEENPVDTSKNNNLNQVPKLSFNQDQKRIVEKIKKINFREFNVILLEGITGSGKTRVYMQKVIDVIKFGYQCLILVPEKILTTQWVKEIERDYNLNPAIYHSSIKKKERENIWALINCNKIKLVIGTRSALFLPFKRLGLLVVDEEHDSSYKQEEQVIINARDFSIVRAMNSNCLNILSSATPSLESISNVKKRKYKIFKLLKRVNHSNLPKIKIIDMKKKDVIISKELKDSISENLKDNNQTLIFINKRGYAPFVICKKCGFSKICKNCNSSLVLHNFKEKLKSYLLCHHCNYREVFLNKCPMCGVDDTLDFPGFGIEKIYSEITRIFPNANTCILSSDTIKSSKKFRSIVNDIVSNKINIIIGTQLISKGHNFPSLKTVGILNIDNLINDFDFRSFEKTFQQIVQVGGRAGRKNLDGEVFIQTIQPDHPVIKMCEKNKFNDFLEWELESRKKNQQPPFYNYISLIFSSRDEKKVMLFSKKISELLRNQFKTINIYGPAPAILYKKRSDFRYRLLIKLNKVNKIQEKVKYFLAKISKPSSIKFHIDVDPINFI